MWKRFRSSAVFFHFCLQYLKVLLYNSFTCLVRFIPRFLCGYCKKDCCSDFFFLSVLSFVYRKVTDFVLILYLINLLKVFTSWRSFLMESLGSCTHKIISLSSKDTFISSFPIPIPLISAVSLF